MSFRILRERSLRGAGAGVDDAGRSNLRVGLPSLLEWTEVGQVVIVDNCTGELTADDSDLF